MRDVMDREEWVGQVVGIWWRGVHRLGLGGGGMRGRFGLRGGLCRGRFWDGNLDKLGGLDVVREKAGEG
jgi:hypothetical protein